MPSRLGMQQGRAGLHREAGRLDPAASGSPRRSETEGAASVQETSLPKKAEVNLGLPFLPYSLTQHSQTATWSLVTMATNGQCLSQGQAHLPTPQGDVSVEDVEDGKFSHNSQWPRRLRPCTRAE